MSPRTLTELAEFLRHAPNREFWIVAILLIALCGYCIYSGFRALHRSRMLADLPTSKVRSAAQGYVELEGRARMMPGEPVHAPLSGLPCAWYRFQVEELQEDREGRSKSWHTIESGVSDAIFHLEDETGRCIVDPDGAEITPSVRLCWRGQMQRPGFAPRETGFWSTWLTSGPYRYTEYRIQENDALYAVGQFTGLGDAGGMALSEATRDLLSTWKRDRTSLLQRFDQNGDGQIDLAEWENARLAAEWEVLATVRDRQQHPEFNLLKKSPYGKPFLLSCIPQHTLIHRYRRTALIMLVGFLTLGSGLTWSIHLRLQDVGSQMKVSGRDSISTMEKRWNDGDDSSSFSSR